MTDKPASKPLTVRDLQALLADCDPDGVVNLYLPAFAWKSDNSFSRNAEVDGIESEFTPEVSASFRTSRGAPYDTFFHNNGRVREGVRPNSVSIVLSAQDQEGLIAFRKRSIEDDNPSADMESEPFIADDDSVVVDVKLPRNLHTTIRRLLRIVNASPQVKVEQACTHGLLTVAGAMEMLAEDLCMVATRPGSWEAANMAQVLASHGYKYPQ